MFKSIRYTVNSFHFHLSNAINTARTMFRLNVESLQFDVTRAYIGQNFQRFDGQNRIG